MMEQAEILHAIEKTIQEIERNLREAKKHNDTKNMYTYTTCYNIVNTLLGLMRYGPRQGNDNLQRDFFHRRVPSKDSDGVDKAT